jgi:hypothetical protein
MIKDNFSNFSKPSSHILGLHEDLDMKLEDLFELFSNLVYGSIGEVQEKIDGQNLTFTVRNEKVEVYYKGVDWNRFQKPGKSYDAWDVDYNHLPQVRDAYKRSHKAIQNFVNLNKNISNRLFQNGKLAMESSILFPENPNTISYDRSHIVFIECYPMDPSLKGNFDLCAFKEWIEESKKITGELKFCKVPLLKIKKSSDCDKILNHAEVTLNSLQKRFNLNNSSTIGDLLVSLAQSDIAEMGVGDSTAKKMAIRLVTGNKSQFCKNQTSHAPWLWNLIQKLESSYFKEKSAIPLEKLIHDISIHVFDNLEFQIASNELNSGKTLRDFVCKVRKARSSSKIICTQKQIDLIDVSLSRIGDENRFKKAAEGIVFDWKNNQKKKLTGLFTPINRLRGVFVYGDSPARLI